MDLERLAAMVAEAQQARGISDYLLEHEIGVVKGKAFNAQQISRLKQGKRILPIPPEVVYRMIRILGLNALAASEAAGVWPEHFTADMLRKLDPVGAHGEKVIGWYAPTPGHGPVLVPVPADLGELVRRNRRPPVLAALEVAA